MDKCVLMPDEEEALTKAFNNSKIPKEVTGATCNIHTEFKLAKKKMSNGVCFGKR